VEYFQEVLDRASGELIKISQGDWITITELGEIMGAGKRETRAILRDMDFLVIEGRGRNARHRLAYWVTERGWGRRLSRRGSYPFDVVGPEARKWVEERWEEIAEKTRSLSPEGETARSHLATFIAHRRNPDMPPQEQVCWLCDFYPRLSQSEKGRIIGISQQLVSRFEEVRRRQRQRRLTNRERAVLSAVPLGGGTMMSVDI
jgi:hypothetical protein